MLWQASPCWELMRVMNLFVEPDELIGRGGITAEVEYDDRGTARLQNTGSESRQATPILREKQNVN